MTGRHQKLVDGMKKDSGVFKAIVRESSFKANTEDDLNGDIVPDMIVCNEDPALFDLSVRVLPLSVGRRYSALERLLLTANGNLQRIVSSWYNSKVTVKVCYNHLLDVQQVDAPEVTLTLPGKQRFVSESSAQVRKGGLDVDGMRRDVDGMRRDVDGTRRDVDEGATSVRTDMERCSGNRCKIGDTATERHAHTREAQHHAHADEIQHHAHANNSQHHAHANNSQHHAHTNDTSITTHATPPPEPPPTPRDYTYKREVELVTLNQLFLRARSTVTISNQTYYNAIASNRVGIGQLFRTFNIRPCFQLLSEERISDVGDDDVEALFLNGIKRRYLLFSPSGITCDITEFIVPGVFELKESAEEVSGDGQPAARGSHFGDIMQGTQVQVTTENDSGLTPLERVLLSANGNMTRLLSSLLNASIHVDVLKLEVENKGTTSLMTINRQVQLRCGTDTVLCHATSTIKIFDEGLKNEILSGAVMLGSDVFRYLKVLPEFSLEGYVKQAPEAGSFERTYSLSTKGSVEIQVVERLFSRKLGVLIEGL